MPELPDVVIYKNNLKLALNKKIKSVYVANDASEILDISSTTLRRKLTHKKLIKAERYGKYLLAKISNLDKHLIFHFGMTGDLVFEKQSQDFIGKKYVKIGLEFGNNQELYYINKRKLGKIFIKNKQTFLKQKDLGMDALEINQRYFKEI